MVEVKSFQKKKAEGAKKKKKKNQKKKKKKNQKKTPPTTKKPQHTPNSHSWYMGISQKTPRLETRGKKGGWGAGVWNGEEKEGGRGGGGWQGGGVEQRKGLEYKWRGGRGNE